VPELSFTDHSISVAARESPSFVKLNVDASIICGGDDVIVPIDTFGSFEKQIGDESASTRTVIVVDVEEQALDAVASIDEGLRGLILSGLIGGLTERVGAFKGEANAPVKPRDA